MSVINGCVIEGACDYHVHLRGGAGEGNLFDLAIVDTTRHFKRFLAMPNLHPDPIEDADGVRAYRAKILAAAPDAEPILSIYLTPRTIPDTVIKAAKAGATAVKYYPKGGTTNSAFGLTPAELLGCRDIFAAMTEVGMVLCLHGEDPSKHDPLDRERAFLRNFTEIARDFPKLRIVFEHVSSAMGLRYALSFPNAAVTVTPHHLVLTTADVIGDHDCLCMPVAKSESDRRALLQAVMSGDPRVLPGTDSAPHSRAGKNLARGKYGLYVAPVAVAVYAQTFAKHHQLRKLSAFLSRSEFYGLPRAKGAIEIVRESWTVPDPIDDPKHDPATTVRPFMAGKTLSFRVRPLSP